MVRGRGEGDPVKAGGTGRCHTDKKNLRDDVKWVLVPQSDTGRQAEQAKTLEITLAKELGKLAP